MTNLKNYYLNRSLHYTKRNNFTQALIALENINAAKEPKVWFSGPKKPKTAKLEKVDRLDINKTLNKAGFDGNGRFKSVGESHNILAGVLEESGIEFDEVLSAWSYKEPKGRKTIKVAFQTDDPFWPVSITNSHLAFSWFEVSPNKYEILVYLS